MARDLLRESGGNGRPTGDVVHLQLGDVEIGAHADLHEPAAINADVLAAVRDALMVTERDKLAAGMVTAVLGAAKMLDPITRVVTARILGLLTGAAATGIAVYTIRLTESWERVAVCVAFAALAAWLIKRGQDAKL